MIKKLILGACLACGLVQVECGGMNKVKSEDCLTCKKLVVFGDVAKESQRKLSEPVSRGEKSEALRRVSVGEFLKMNESETQQYEDVEFHHVKINDEFVDKFWELFSNFVEIRELGFELCSLSEGHHFSDVIASGCPSNSLKVINCNVCVDEASDILLHVNPYTVTSVDFSGNNLNKEDPNFQKMLRLRVYDIMCLERADLHVD